MLILQIFLGLFGLGIVVFIHELGHFVAARLVKIDVEAFSIGWGNPVLKKKIGEVEYRLGMFPLGGYCKFKGSSDHGADEYNEAYDLFKQGKKPEEGSYLAASPAARMFTCFCGPFFNLIFAVLLLSILWGVGFEYPAFENKIALLSERIEEVEQAPDIANDGDLFPADEAGLKTGDRVIEIDGKRVNYFHELREIIALNPNKELTLLVEREGEGTLELQITPTLNKSNGMGQIGVLLFSDNYEIIRTPKYNIFTAIGKGFAESWKSLTVSLKSLRLLFMGIDLTQAVSGPVRITYMIGEMATAGFEQSFGTGLRSIAEFLALISVALCIMNLLPLPVIDGGMIILFFVELIRGKPAHPKAVSIFQSFGFAIIFCLLIFAVFGDILYFVRR